MMMLLHGLLPPLLFTSAAAWKQPTDAHSISPRRARAEARGAAACFATSASEDDATATSSSSVAALAMRAAEAIEERRALVEPDFLAGAGLDAARADMATVFGQIAAEGGLNSADGDFHSLQTDLLHPSMRDAPGLPFAGLLTELETLRVALADATGRPLLEGGGLHLMRYPTGSKFMRHVDEDAALYEPVRNSISFLIYLTPDDWAASDGGALRVYEEGADSEPRSVLPAGGTLVIYDSSVEHEVLPTSRVRDLLSGRFRETNEDWEQGR